MTMKNAAPQNTDIDLKADDIIECIPHRKGGTVVDFGFHNKRKVKYHFKPIDPTDPDSPHVCNVPNDEHYDRFLEIPEAYRAYFHDQEYEPAYAVPTPKQERDEYDPRNDFADLLSVNADDVSNDWLGRFTKEIIGIKLTQKQDLADYAQTHYELDFDYGTTTAAEIARLILKERIEEERNASDSAS